MANPGIATSQPKADADLAGLPVLGRLVRAWLVSGIVVFLVAASVAYRFSLDGPVAVVVTVVPVFTAVAMVIGLATPLRGWSPTVRLIATLVTLVGWSVLMFDDDRWSILTFALYGLCFSCGRIRGIVLAAVVAIVWAAAFLAGDEPGWVVIIPTASLAIGAVLSVVLWGADEENAAQASLICQLQAAQQNLAVSEREKGVLEERARFAGEIHDTLAQGFTSIVLVSRATQRNEQWREGLTAIEETAEDNLQAARRLVNAIGPAELDAASLTDAIQRQVTTTLPPETTVELQVAGDPRPLTGALEVTLLRAAQEALLNIRTHAEASEVHLTLTYLDDIVALDVRDNGTGFTPGVTTDRGALTGGQGLKALEHRTATLGGQLTIETGEGGGSVLSVQLPAAQP